MRNYYTKKDEAYIKKMYEQGFSPEHIANHLGRTPDQIRCKAASLGCRREREIRWKPWEEKFLRDNLKKMTNKEIGRVLNRSESAVKGKISRMGLQRDPQQKINPNGRSWTDEETNYVLDHYGKCSTASIAQHLNRTESSVTNRATVLGLRTPTVKYWTQEEDDYLEEHYSHMSAKKIAKKLHRTVESVKGRAVRLNLSAYHNEHLQFADIAMAFGVEKSTVSYWCKNNGLPAKKVTRGKNCQYLVDVGKFWDWAAEHLQIVPMRNYERMTLIPEPENIGELIRMNAQMTAPKRRKPITPSLRRNIEHDYRRGMPVNEIASKYERSVYSIKHILTDIHKTL